jgi:hypothetical protein
LFGIACDGAARQALTKLGVTWELTEAQRAYNEGRSTQVPVTGIENILHGWQAVGNYLSVAHIVGEPTIRFFHNWGPGFARLRGGPAAVGFKSGRCCDLGSRYR